MARTSTRRRHQRLQLACLLLAAGRTVARSLTLSDFQLISSFSVPLNCIVAYNAPLYRCKISDFTMGNACSARCERSIERVQENIQASCQSVDASDHTLLYKAQRGNLLGVLCENEDKPSVTSTFVVPITTSARTTTSQPTTIQTFVTISTKESSTEQTSQTLPTTTEEKTTVEPPATTSEPTTSDDASTTISFVTTTTQEEETSTTSVTTDSDPTETAAVASSTESAESISTTESAAPRRTVLPGSGGGSPFDFVASGPSIRPHDLTSVASAFLLAVCAIVLR